MIKTYLLILLFLVSILKLGFSQISGNKNIEIPELYQVKGTDKFFFSIQIGVFEAPVNKNIANHYCGFPFMMSSEIFVQNRNQYVQNRNQHFQNIYFFFACTGCKFAAIIIHYL